MSDSATPWNVAHRVPLSVGFSRQEYWSRLSFSSPGDLPDPGIESVSLGCPALAGGFLTTSATWGFKFLFILLFIFGCAGSSLLCRLFYSCGERGYPLAVVLGLLMAVASLVSELRLWGV